MELDQLYKKLNISVERRLELIEGNLGLTNSRDDLYLERIALYNMIGNYEKSEALIEQRKFHPWEGGEGKVTSQYLTTKIELAKKSLNKKNYKNAIQYLEQAQTYPNNLGEGKLFGTGENEIFYWLGCAYHGLGEEILAKRFIVKATKGSSDPSLAIFYNDQQPDNIFYQGMALLKLGKIEDANIRFQNLLNYGKEHVNDKVKLDYFAISLPDLLIWEEDLNVVNYIHCNYLIGLGLLGLGQKEEALNAFKKVTSICYHLPAHIHSNLEINKKIDKHLP